MRPFYEDGRTALYLGDCREILPQLGVSADAVITDPPYAETSLGWDRWPENWPRLMLPLAPVLWCFGSMRMFLDRSGEFAPWKMAQDLVWEKHNGSGLNADRFRRVHENAVMFYNGEWASIYKATPVMAGTARERVLQRGAKPAHYGAVEAGTGYKYGETRLMRSVIRVPSCHGRALHPTEKPLGILEPLLSYSVRPGEWVIDCFAGSGSVLEAAKVTGRYAIGVEADEAMCEVAAKRLQSVLQF